MNTKFTIAMIAAAVALAGCGYEYTPSSDKQQSEQQEAILKEGTAAVGMPNITNFRERRKVKENLERRDQEGLVTYTYTFSEVTGKFSFFCSSVGFPIPYATQFTNPEKISRADTYGIAILPQADPNGLFSPSSAEGSWVDCVNPQTKKVSTVYVEPRVMASEFPLPGVPVE